MPHRVAQQTPQGLEKVTKWSQLVSNHRRADEASWRFAGSARATGVTGVVVSRIVGEFASARRANQPESWYQPLIRKHPDRIAFFLVDTGDPATRGGGRLGTVADRRFTEQNGDDTVGTREVPHGAFIAIDNHCDPHLR